MTSTSPTEHIALDRANGTSLPQSLRTVGLFAGIGGLELGLARAGHHTLEMCEIDDAARAVLEARFPGVPVRRDVTQYETAPADADLIVGGFPCQDLSQAGRTLGIGGSQSGLVGEVFRLLRKRPVKWLLLENVAFMLRLGRGQAMTLIIDNLEQLGYHWAYRLVDTRAFGLPHRRERVFIIAAQGEDPRGVLLADDAGSLPPPPTDGIAYGFYWTEGTRGLGWAPDSVPTLKGGSTVGIPSPPGVWLPSGEIVTPSIEDAERLQGFPPGWTAPAEAVARKGARWKLVGNAVTVDVAEWVGARLAAPGLYRDRDDRELAPKRTLPNAAYNVGYGRRVADVSVAPVRRHVQHLHEFLHPSGRRPLSAKATAGFLSRFLQSSLNKPEGFVAALQEHLTRLTNGSEGERRN